MLIFTELPLFGSSLFHVYGRTVGIITTQVAHFRNCFAKAHAAAVERSS